VPSPTPNTCTNTPQLPATPPPTEFRLDGYTGRDIRYSSPLSAIKDSDGVVAWWEAYCQRREDEKYGGAETPTKALLVTPDSCCGVSPDMERKESKSLVLAGVGTNGGWAMSLRNAPENNSTSSLERIGSMTDENEMAGIPYVIGGGEITNTIYTVGTPVTATTSSCDNETASTVGVHVDVFQLRDVSGTPGIESLNTGQDSLKPASEISCSDVDDYNDNTAATTTMIVEQAIATFEALASLADIVEDDAVTVDPAIVDPEDTCTDTPPSTSEFRADASGNSSISLDDFSRGEATTAVESDEVAKDTTSGVHTNAAVVGENSTDTPTFDPVTSGGSYIDVPPVESYIDDPLSSTDFGSDTLTTTPIIIDDSDDKATTFEPEENSLYVLEVPETPVTGVENYAYDDSATFDTPKDTDVSSLSGICASAGTDNSNYGSIDFRADSETTTMILDGEVTTSPDYIVAMEPEEICIHDTGEVPAPPAVVVNSKRTTSVTPSAPAYYIHRLLKKRKYNAEPQYLVEWQGYPRSKASWEPEEALMEDMGDAELWEELVATLPKKRKRRRRD